MSRKKLLKVVIAASLAVIATALASSRIEAKSPKQSEHDRIVKFWTNRRVAKAIPRDFVRNARTRSYKQIRWNRGLRTASTAATWTGAGEVSRTTGKVYFSMGGVYYVCSGSVIAEDASDRSIIVTAGHCAYDEVNGNFAANWLFVPEYYAKPASLNPDQSFCEDTKNGCWTSSVFVVSSEYAEAGAFNDQAVKHDYAFAIVRTGGLTGSADLQTVTGSHPIVAATRTAGVDTWIFGYPAANRYKGKALMYCTGTLGFDTRLNSETYRLPCSLTAGSSGGPWLNPFVSETGIGDQFSVNSYSYGGSKAMYGPIFGNEAAQMFVKSKTTNSSVEYVMTP